MPQEGQIALLIPIIALMIPIIYILIRHQQRMAEIVHSSGTQQRNSDVEQLRREVAELKTLIHHQTLQLDSMLQRQQQAGLGQPDVGSRLNS